MGIRPRTTATEAPAILPAAIGALTIESMAATSAVGGPGEPPPQAARSTSPIVAERGRAVGSRQAA
jgi:hypothetical protein